MSVEDWARREAERAFDGVHIFTAHGFQLGIVHAFSALLSDKAVEAGAQAQSARAGDGLWSDQPEGRRIAFRRDFRAALQAAVTAVTEGDTK